MDIVERMKAMLDAGDAVGGISRVFVPADDVRDLLAEIERLRSLSELVRDGYVMVPREPTGDMRREGKNEFLTENIKDQSIEGKCARIYRAMLSASPKQEDGNERDEIIEMCAKVADYGVERAQRDWRNSEKADGAQEMAQEIADAIRSRKQSPVTGKEGE